MTATRVKFVVVLYDENLVQEPDLREFFAKAHAAYVEYMFNPFNTLDTDKIESNRFHSSIDLAVISHLEKPAPSANSKHGNNGAPPGTPVVVNATVVNTPNNGNRHHPSHPSHHQGEPSPATVVLAPGSAAATASSGTTKKTLATPVKKPPPPPPPPRNHD
mmetsp:Transcript_28951/g.93335  ORF Transcript_28951/g.93335 Transcript_28951/m.93335 type:complete len:161 (+) Transcript_28951:1715-2197(+)